MLRWRMLVAALPLFTIIYRAGAVVHHVPLHVRPGHSHECYIPRLKTFLPLREVRFLSGCRAMTCTRIGKQHLMKIAECNPPLLRPEHCVEIYTDRAARYPHCCPSFDCPRVFDVEVSAHVTHVGTGKGKKGNGKKHKPRVAQKL
ncbi:uncharacterized protein LOC122371041 [Amphibalanus amphitrite]|uniref:uncharacterized protein LOC122371041 n=1 Tax=Amphibalanus amphitrite TaxID=1232801 RepID=UPI001C90D316|nr:uncharacterized protein LOC122371041 [Amphibalanus amphitrite]